MSVPPASVVIETPNEMASSSTPRYPWRVVPPAAADILPSPTEMGSSSAARFAWRSGVGASGRRQSSLEGGDLEDLMETRRQVEQRRLLLQADSTTPSDEDEEPKSKVRYNDMGSLEQVRTGREDQHSLPFSVPSLMILGLWNVKVRIILTTQSLSSARKQNVLYFNS